jgi:hypothetical protein
MAVSAANVWTQWVTYGTGGSYTIDSSGVLNIVKLTAGVSRSLYLAINVQGGDTIEFACKAQANSGQGRQWINYGSVGSASGGAPSMLIANNKDYRPSVLKAVVPASFNMTTCYIGIGCTTVDVGDISIMEPVITLNGTQIYFGMDPNSNPVRYNNLSSGLDRTLVSPTTFTDVNGGYDALYGNVGTWSPSLRVSGYTNDTASFGIVRYSNDVDAPSFRFGKTRTTVPGTTPSAPTQANDLLGAIDANGDDGTIFTPGGRIEFIQDGAVGTYAPTKIVFKCSTGLINRALYLVLNSVGQLYPGSDNTQDFGTTSVRWANVYSTQFRPGSSGSVIWTSGAGTPEGVVTAVVGSLYTRTNGGAGSTLYVKESGTGNTGWVAK